MKRYYIQFHYGKNTRTDEPIVIKRMVDRDKSPITSISRAKEYMKELKEDAEKDLKLKYDNHMSYT